VRIYGFVSGLSYNFLHMGVTFVAALLGLTGLGVALLKVGGYYFEHKGGSTKSVGAAAALVGFAFLVVAIAIVWLVRIQHMFR